MADDPATRPLDVAFRQLRDASSTDADIDQVAEMLDEATARVGAQVEENLQKRTPAMLRNHRQLQRSFHRRLRRTWGKALDVHYAARVAAQEMGTLVLESSAPDLALEVLADLHAQAARVALEVHVLLGAGLPSGALARCRTLHELAVVSCIIAERSVDEALAMSYRAHQIVAQYRDAKDYQEHCAALGYAPLDEAEVERMREASERAVAAHPPGFSGNFGWAASLFDPPLKFATLEREAGLVHLRPFYRWACHSVHADSRAAILNRVAIAGVEHRVSGRLEIGLGDPGSHSLISLQQVTTALVCRRTAFPPPLESLVMLRALGVLVDRAQDEFLRAHQRMENSAEGIA